MRHASKRPQNREAINCGAFHLGSPQRGWCSAGLVEPTAASGHNGEQTMGAQDSYSTVFHDMTSVTGDWRDLQDLPGSL